MQFSRVGKHTIRCVISEQEILDMGYTMEEIMSNGERTQEFVNQILIWQSSVLKRNLTWELKLSVQISCRIIRWHSLFQNIRDRMR